MSAAFVQGITNISGSTGFTLAMPGNTVAGHTMIVIVNHSYPGCPPTVTDSQSNTYTAVGSHTALGNRNWWVFTAPIVASAACTVTVTFSCGVTRSSFALEYADLDVAPFDQENSNANTVNPCTAGSVTPTTNGQLILSHFRGPTAATLTSGGSATTRLTADAALFDDIVQDEIQTTAGAITPQAEASVFSEEEAYGFVATFKAIAGAAALRKATLSTQAVNRASTF